MKAEFINRPFQVKPIPKYILAEIRKKDLRAWPEQTAVLRMYSYLTKFQKELVKIMVAVRNHKKQWYCKQVAIHGVKSDNCLVRDIEYKYFGMGYRVGWYAQGLTKYMPWYEDGKWYSVDFKYYNPYTVPVNLEYIGKFPEYRHSAYQHFKGFCIIKYLKLYGQYPQTEYLLKAGLHKIHDSVTVLKRIAKDKNFYRWLIAHKTEIMSENCYVGSIMQAYKTGKPIKQVQAFAECKKRLEQDNTLRPIKELFGRDFENNSLEQFFLYLDEQGTSPRSYLDYLNACNYLRLDMNRRKNCFPHDFKRWHDIRIEQYHTAKALADEHERAELHKQFAAVAEKYMPLQKTKKDEYAIIIAASPAELLHEGDILRHCVGKMGYDQRMARQESLIFFVRNILAPNIPFVTIEYSLETKKILQCYGYMNSKPDNNVMAFINKTWLPYANKTLKKVLRTPALITINQNIAV